MNCISWWRKNNLKPDDPEKYFDPPVATKTDGGVVVVFEETGERVEFVEVDKEEADTILVLGEIGDKRRRAVHMAVAEDDKFSHRPGVDKEVTLVEPWQIRPDGRYSADTITFDAEGNPQRDTPKEEKMFLRRKV